MRLLRHYSLARIANSCRRGFTSTGGVRIAQRLGSSNTKEVIEYVSSGPNHSLKKYSHKDVSLPVQAKNASQDFINTFVPKGFPHSVSAGYGRYATGHFISSVFSSAGGVLSMQALLHAVGLGAGAIPLAATLNWVMKDGLGQLGGVLFASLVNNRFDADPKKWRLFASISMELSSLLEFMTPLCPQYFLPIASVANVGKNISFLAASASRAAIHHSYAVNENLADVTAKAGSQSICASTIGTGLGIGIASLLGHQYECSLIAFVACASLGLLSLRESLTGVCIHALSPDKLMYVYGQYRMDTMSQKDNIEPIALLNPKQVAAAEADSVLLQLSYDKILLDIACSDQYARFAGDSTVCAAAAQCPVNIGADVGTVFPETYTEISKHLDMFAQHGYIIKINFNERSPQTIHILYRQGATVKDIIESYAHAFEVKCLLARHNKDVKFASAVDAVGSPWPSEEFLLNEHYIAQSRAALDKPVNYWSKERSSVDSESSAKKQPPQSTVEYFIENIGRIGGHGDDADVSGDQGLVRGGSLGWQVNPLLLEQRYARVVCSYSPHASS